MKVNWARKAVAQLLEFAIREIPLREHAVQALILQDGTQEILPKRVQWRPETLAKLESLLWNNGSPMHGALLSFMITNIQIFPKRAKTRVITRALDVQELMPAAVLLSVKEQLPHADKIVKRALSATSTRTVRAALKAAMTLGSGFIRTNSGHILAQCRSSNRGVRVEVCRALATLDRAQAEESLKKLFLDRERSVRREALIALNNLGSPAARSYNLLALQDPSPLVRVEACQMLSNNNEQGVLEALLERFRDTSGKVREEAFKAVANRDRGFALRHLSTIGGEEWQLDQLLSKISATKEEREAALQSTPSFASTEEKRDFASMEEEWDFASTEEKQLYQYGLNALIDSESDTDFFSDWWIEDDPALISLLRHLYCGRLAVAALFGCDLAGIDALKLYKCLYPKNICLPGNKVKNIIGRIIRGCRRSDVKSLSGLAADLLDVATGLDQSASSAQAFYIGLMHGPNTILDACVDIFPKKLDRFIVQKTLLAERVRQAEQIDEAFLILSRRMVTRTRVVGQIVEAMPPGRVQIPISDSLAMWARIRATPICLGFLLLSLSDEDTRINPWQCITGTQPLRPDTEYLIDRYGRLPDGKSVLASIQSGWLERRFDKDASEIAVLAGALERSIVALFTDGQLNLFVR